MLQYMIRDKMCGLWYMKSHKLCVKNGSITVLCMDGHMTHMREEVHELQKAISAMFQTTYITSQDF